MAYSEETEAATALGEEHAYTDYTMMATLAGVTYELIFYSISSTSVDDDGLFMCSSGGPIFSTGIAENYVDNLASTEVGIIKEIFYSSETGEVMSIYYTVSDINSPTISVNEDDTDINDVSYASAEKTALKSKFGNSSGLSTEELIQSKFSSLTADAAATTLSVAYLFDKIHYPDFRKESLSYFETQEGTQPTTATTTYTSATTTPTSDSGY